MKERKETCLNDQIVYESVLLQNKINSILEISFDTKNVDSTIVPSPDNVDADYGIFTGRYAPQIKEKIDAVKENIISNNPVIKDIELSGAYLNFKLEMGLFGKGVVDQVLKMGKDYGKENIGKGKTVVVDMSAPNIAKRMNYGHLRSTIIGDALSNMYRTEGFTVIRDNHIGDWGTQFGKMITAIKLWGNEEKLLKAKDPIKVLQNLYVKFHSEEKIQSDKLRDQIKEDLKQKGIENFPDLKKAINDVENELMKRKNIKREDLNQETILEDALDRVVVSQLEKEGRDWFLKLEKGDPEAQRIWKMCIELSMKEFNQIYETLGVDFEYTLGESFYQDKLQNVIKEANEKGIGKISEGALVIDLDDKKLGKVIIQKSDGASVYMTRDIATAIFREKEFKADRLVYVVGEDQKLYFKQLFEILNKLDYKIGNNSKHIYFGMVSLPEGKMSTRKGRVILLKDVIEKGLKRADQILREKNPEFYKNEELRNKTIKAIAIGSLKWNDLGQDPKREIIFDWDKALNFEGYACPYVQYTAVRAKSIINSSGYLVEEIKNKNIDKGSFKDKIESKLLKLLAEYPSIIRKALETSNPSKVASYIFELAKNYNNFYSSLPVLNLKDESVKNSRLKLTLATYQVISNALGILGIEVPDQM